MTVNELQDVLTILIDRNTTTLNATPTGGTGVIRIEDMHTGELFSVEIKEAG